MPAPEIRWWGLAVGLLMGRVRPVAAQQVAAAQPAPVRQLALKAGLSPLLAKGYHVSLEKAFGSSLQHSANLTPQLYLGRVSSYTSEQNEGGHDYVRGFGLDFQYRYYVPSSVGPLAGVYVAARPHVQRFRIDFRARGWQQVAAANGLLYHDHLLQDQTEHITRIGASAIIGNQFFITGTPVSLDVSFGMGWRHAAVRTSAPPASRYASSPNDYSHSGFYVPLNVKAGMIF